MDKKFGYYVLVGAFLGLIWSAGNNPLSSLGIGARIGTFLG